MNWSTRCKKNKKENSKKRKKTEIGASEDISKTMWRERERIMINKKREAKIQLIAI